MVTADTIVRSRARASGPLSLRADAGFCQARKACWDHKVTHSITARCKEADEKASEAVEEKTWVPIAPGARENDTPASRARASGKADAAKSRPDTRITGLWRWIELVRAVR
ncbi:MAG: hypothetical protein ABSD97_04005 [Acidimicrobiales bacterium]